MPDEDSFRCRNRCLVLLLALLPSSLLTALLIVNVTSEVFTPRSGAKISVNCCCFVALNDSTVSLLIDRSKVVVIAAAVGAAVGASVGASVGAVGASVGAAVGASVGTAVGASVGVVVGSLVGAVGAVVGALVGPAVGLALGASVGAVVGAAEGESEGALVGEAVGAMDGTHENQAVFMIWVVSSSQSWKQFARAWPSSKTVLVVINSTTNSQYSSRMMGPVFAKSRSLPVPESQSKNGLHSPIKLLRSSSS